MPASDQATPILPGLSPIGGREIAGQRVPFSDRDVAEHALAEWEAGGGDA